MGIASRLPELAGLLTASLSTAHAVHLDIELRGEGPKLTATFCATAGVGCDLPAALGQLNLPAGKLPIDGASGAPIFVADFGDFPKPYDTANPGFNAADGALIPNELIAYRALGHLRYWSPELKQWNAADSSVRIRLFGGLTSTQVVTDPGQCGGLLLCVPGGTGFEEGSTVFSGTGLSGPETLLINNASARGGLHDHLDWFLERSNGSKGGPVGAYLVEMQVVSDRRSQASAPLLIAFNNGLEGTAFVEAIAARMAAPPGPVPAPEPSPEEPPVSPISEPEPAPQPAIEAERTFRRFAYRESAAEKLTGCPSSCAEQTRGSALLDARFALDEASAAALLENTGRVVLTLGTHVFEGERGAATPLKLRRGRTSLRVPLLNSGGSGVMDIIWNGREMQISGKLIGAGVFANTYLDRSGPRNATPESVRVDFVRTDGSIPLRVAATVSVSVKNQSARTIRRAGTRFTLANIRMGGRLQ